MAEEGAEQALRAASAEGFCAVAVVCLHGYRYPEHEARLGELAVQAGFTQVSLSHATSPLMKLVSRGDTTVVDAYLSPVIARYSGRVTGELPGVRVQFMQSHGGLTGARSFRGKDSILSGPAGGIVGMARTAQAAGFGRVIGFDMGGTSTDVSHFAGEFERQYETQVAGVRMRAPMLAIHTVAAGGGSILHFDGSRYRVGPDSAGANPGPASYRGGGPLTVTDCNLMLGKIQPKFFPLVFGPGGDAPLDGEVVRAKFSALAEEIHRATGDTRIPEQVAEGFVEIAVGNMAEAIKKISVQRGHDVTEYTLCCFGGAAGQHACLVADALGMTRVFVHPLAGVLSAYGMGLADTVAMREQALEARLEAGNLSILDRALERLSQMAREELVSQGVAPERVRLVRRVHLRYDGTDSALVVEFGGLEDIVARFEAAYRMRYSFLMPGRGLVAESVSVDASGAAAVPVEPADKEPQGTGTAAPADWARVHTGGRAQRAPVFVRERLAVGDRICGPAIIVE